MTDRCHQRALSRDEHSSHVPSGRCDHDPDSAGIIRVPSTSANSATEPPGLYWYHPHVHGFAEFQVNGGAAGALIVEGMEKIHPEVAGLTERVFVIRQQYLVPWIPGPYQLTINYQVSR